MASIRNLKKDVDYLVSEVLSDSYTCMIINDNVDKEKVIGVMEAAVELRNDLFDKINTVPDGKEAKSVKAYYNLIRKELCEGTGKLFEELSGVLTASGKNGQK